MGPNVIVKNRTNDLYKYALKDKKSLGPKWVRMFPRLARAAVSKNSESKGWNIERLNEEVDKAIRKLLKEKCEP